MIAERSLFPAAICIVRALMHSAFLWCSCHCQDLVAAELVAVVNSKVQVTPNDLPQFFWDHLQKDVEHLSRVTQLTLEESAIIIHMVLHGILKKTLRECENSFGMIVIIMLLVLFACWLFYLPPAFAVPYTCYRHVNYVSLMILAVDMAKKYSLEDRDDREEWEEEFSKFYIEPIIHRDLKTQVMEVMNIVGNDYQQGNW